MFLTFLCQYLTFIFGPSFWKRKKFMPPSQHILSPLAFFSLLKSYQQFLWGLIWVKADGKSETHWLQRSHFHEVCSTSEWTKLSKNTVLIFLRNNLCTNSYLERRCIVTTWMQCPSTCQKNKKESALSLSHSRQNAAWRNFINRSAKLALGWRSWQPGKQRNIPVWNVNTTDLKIFETINIRSSHVILKSVFRELIQEQPMLEWTSTPRWTIYCQNNSYDTHRR